MGMFCFQCEQTAKGSGCNAYGVCGKDPETAALQDLLVHATLGIAVYAAALPAERRPHEADIFIADALFSTVTNVNFDPQRLQELLRQAAQVKAELLGLNPAVTVAEDGPTAWQPAADLDELIRQGERVSIEPRLRKYGPDIVGLQELLLYGLKGTAAYAVHARLLGQEDPKVYDFFHQALSYLATGPFAMDKLLEYVLRCGEVNLRVMELLDQAHTGTYGRPIPTKVSISALKGKAILVSGHDLGDLAELLKQTAGSGINVYTHGEMLPAHGYPELKKYPHLVGNYGGAWQDQAAEFDAFPGPILMTTNCIQKPKASYQDRIFTSGLVAWPGVQHISGHDYAPLIAAAHQADGFPADAPERTILVGFGHDTVLGLADQVVAAVKSGAIRHFFLIGGCDGAKPGRNYFTEFAQAVPPDAVILTLACGKYRFNKEDFGAIGGIPRLLDVGQCNDAYSAIRIASGLAQAFNCGVNDLPLSLILSWYEQKAVCILLTLLHLGIRKIRLGPSLPAFISPAVLKVLVDNFELQPIGEAQADLEACLAGH